MKTYIAIITKSPWPKGRVGKREHQDWYRACLKARDLALAIPQSAIIVTVATQISGSGNEADYYMETMRELGVPIVNLGRGYETVNQLEVYRDVSIHDSAELIMLTTWSHYLRVAWLCKRKKINAKLEVCWGIPRPRELITDVILTFLYPVIDLLGLGDWFQDRVVRRRLSGKL